MFIKIILTVLSFLVLLAIVSFVPKFNNDADVYLLTFGIVIGYVLFPTWLFQGMEYMKYTSILNIIGKVIFTVLIFVFIHQTSDYLLVPIINSFGYIVVGILGIYISLTRFDIDLSIPNKESIKYHLKEGWHVFLSTIAINMYTTTNTFLLGLLTKLAAILGLIFSIGVFIFAEPIINILFGSEYSSSITVLRILSIIPFMVSLSNIFGIQTMLTFNYKEAFTKIVLLGGIIDIVLGIILITLFKEIGIAISFAITETFITLAMLTFLQRKGIKILGKLPVEE